MTDPQVHEKLGVLSAKIDAAHRRIDDIQDYNKDILEQMRSDLKELNAYMHKGKGWAAAGLFLAGLAGAGVVKLLSVVFSHN